MINEFTSEQEGYNRNKYTDRQQKLLDTVWDFGGDTIAAARAAGFSNPYSAVDTLASELTSMADRAIARLAIKSVVTLEKVLDSDGSVKQANEKLKACEAILGRTNPKIDKVEVDVNSKRGLFVLPAKEVPNESD